MSVWHSLAGLHHPVHVGDEDISSHCDALDVATAGRCLTQDLLKSRDLRLEIAVGDHDVRPGGLHQLGVREDLTGAQRQCSQEIEGPASDLNLGVVLDEFAPPREQLEDAELQRRRRLVTARM